jgi:hypothetical protein
LFRFVHGILCANMLQLFFLLPSTNNHLPDRHLDRLGQLHTNTRHRILHPHALLP